jgi:hypothetical protein
VVKGIMKDLKFLYETTVKKQVEEKVTETKEEGGQKIEISKTVKKAKPIKLAILKPQRKLYEGAEIFYAKQIADYIKAGLLPYSLVAKRYANDGGPLSEPEKERLEKLKKEAEELELQFFQLIGDGEKESKTRNELLIKINKINSEVGGIQNAYADIFENTAEMKSRNKTIEWWVLHLAYIDEDDKGFKPLFGEGDLTAKLSVYDDFSDNENDFYNEAIKKLSYLISFWFAARAGLTKIDFESMDTLYDESISSYSVEEDKPAEIKVEEKKVEEKPKVT